MIRLTLSLFLLALSPRGPVLTCRILSAPGNTYGYDIYDKGHLLIHQLSIPGLPGNKGFVRRKDAVKIAGLVIYKLERHLLPPSVSRRELDSLGIKY
jgi:hypothetical protein